MKSIYVNSPYLPDQKKYMKYIDKIYNSKHLTNNGPLVQELEKRLAEYLGVKSIILVANGTLALQIAYKALGLEGEAITTPFSFVATTNSLKWEHITPKFSDINHKSLNLDPTNIEHLITKSTSAIVPVHIFGNPCEVESIEKIAKQYNLKTIYDGAHAFGVNYKDKSILTHGDISTLSFHATKVFHTIEGGAIIVNENKQLELQIREIINFGLDGNGNHSNIGINAKMNEFEAAMGLCVLDEIDTIISKKEMAYNYYYENLKDYVVFQEKNKNSTKNYSFCSILFENEKYVIEVMKKLTEKSIYPKRYFYPSLNTLKFNNTNQICDISEDISTRILCLPMGDDLDIGSMNKVIDTIISTIK
ncbi:DegT/DnrJ/EryC1/StrS family aminotransferase [Sulfurimonas aquatica]|uniref:DegT/DnrJ/EryC1/StrS family aminotransferase n=1 Tax=Sulfurimonas aquatica TaxID=2672570 RepID=A0A975AZ25_9BACT|nr:DegT/DnrJ/EryC1/StrS family aminotransferase [Sulfurimonas aquatica]QSZ41236.1 DegT/DnrJ/EryC1/StrS family aminotransferase [Sulfurimonas aquatica]